MRDSTAHGVIWPIIRREMTTRFGGEGLSYLWALIIPLSWIGFGLVAFEAFDRTLPITTNPALFLATGILPYIVFRQTVLYMTRATCSAKAVRDLPQIHLRQMLWAYAILEGLTTLMVVFLVLIFLNIITNSEMPDNLLFFICIMVFCWLFSTAIGVVICAFALRFTWVTRVLPLLLRPLFWISGVFFVARELPENIAYALSFNPLFVITDTVRSAYFENYDTPLSVEMLIISSLMTIGFCLLALWLGSSRNPSALAP